LKSLRGIAEASAAKVRAINLESIEKSLSLKLLGREKGELLVFAFIILYAFAFSSYTLLHHRSFNTFAWDLGIYNQALWTTVHQGRLFYYTCELHFVPDGSFFGIHFAPILFLLVPLYALVPMPETLLIVQSFILALGAFPLYLIGKQRMSRFFGVVFSLCYLLYPPLHGVNCYDFHVQAFFPVLMLACIYYLDKRNWPKYFMFVFLSLMVQEQVSYIVMFLGLYVFWMYKGKIFSAIRNRKIEDKTILVPFVTTAIGVAWFFFARWVIYSINPSPPPELKAVQNFAVLGVDEPTNIPCYVLENPWNAFGALHYESYEKFSYLMLIFAPLALLSFVSPASLIATVPWFGMAFVSNYSAYYRIGFQYSALIIPFVFSSTVSGAKKLLTRDFISSRIAKQVATLLLVSSSVFCLALSPLSPLIQGGYPSPAYIKPEITDHEAVLEKIIGLIPPNASILTQNNIFPHVSNRPNAYVVFSKIHGQTPTWQNATRFILSLNTTYVLLDLKSEPYVGQVMLSNVIEKKEYGLYASADKILLFKRFYVGKPCLFQPIRIHYDYQNLLAGSGEIVDDTSSVSGKVLYHKSTSQRSNICFWYGPYDVLPFGNYTVCFTLKLGSLTDGHIITLNVHTRGKKDECLDVYSSNFTEANAWQNFTIQFELKQPAVLDIEFRGVNPSNVTDIYLDYIEVVSTDNYS